MWGFEEEPIPLSQMPYSVSYVGLWYQEVASVKVAQIEFSFCPIKSFAGLLPSSSWLWWQWGSIFCLKPSCMNLSETPFQEGEIGWHWLGKEHGTLLPISTEFAQNGSSIRTGSSSVEVGQDMPPGAEKETRSAKCLPLSPPDKRLWLGKARQWRRKRKPKQKPNTLLCRFFDSDKLAEWPDTWFIVDLCFENSQSKSRERSAEPLCVSLTLGTVQAFTVVLHHTASQVRQEKKPT